MIETFLRALERRRASGSRTTDVGLADAVVDQVTRWGARRTLMPDDLILTAAGVPAALETAGIEVITWPTDLAWRPLLGLDDAPATCAITVPTLAVAQRGTVVLATDERHGRSLDAVGWWHLAVIPADRLVPTLAAALTTIYATRIPSAVSLVSGPSRTSDIEKITTYGAHGALAEHVLVVEGIESASADLTNGHDD